MQKPSDPRSTSRSRAVRLHSFGGPEALDLVDVPAPQAGPGQVRVRVAAAGLNRSGPTTRESSTRSATG